MFRSCQIYFLVPLEKFNKSGGKLMKQLHELFVRSFRRGSFLLIETLTVFLAVQMKQKHNITRAIIIRQLINGVSVSQVAHQEFPQ